MTLFDARYPRLTVAPVAPQHAPAIQRLLADGQVAATTRIAHPYPEDGAEAYVAAMQAAWQEGRTYAFAVCFDEPGGEPDVCVGTCGLKDVVGAGADCTAELGYWIGPPYWGRGFATAAVRLVVAFGFERLDLAHVTAHVLEGNPASARVLEKNGFRKTGRSVAPDGCGAPDDATLDYLLHRNAWEEVGR